MDYEFTTVFDLNIDHLATASKDRTSLFMNPAESVLPEKLSASTGQRLMEWAAQGETPPVAKTPPEKPKKKSSVA